MSENSDEEIEIIEHIKPSSNKKWNAPNPIIMQGAENDILNFVRKRLNMDDSLSISLPSGSTDPAYTPAMSTPHKAKDHSSSSPATTPEQIQDLTQDCMASVNEPLGESRGVSCSGTTQTAQSSESSKQTTSGCNSLGELGLAKSLQNAFHVLSEGSRNFSNSPSKSPSIKKRRLTKNSPIRLLPRVINSSKKSPRRSQVNSPGRTSGSSSPSKTAARRMLDLEDVDTTGISLPYYFEAFCAIVKKIHSSSNFHCLFLDRELEKLSQISISRKELQLYVRLMNRKDKWNRVHNIQYPDIALDLNPLFDKLEEDQLIVCDLSEEKLDELVQLASAPELKSICSKFRINVGSKQDMVNRLLSMHKTQPTFGLSPLRQTLLDCLGRCVRLAVQWRQVFRRCILLFSMFHSHEELDKLSQEQALLLLQVKLQNMVFPVTDLEMKQYPELFISRDQFIRYEEAKDLLQKFQNSALEKNHVALEELTKKALLQFSALLELVNETNHILSLPNFLQKFSAGSVYAYVLSLCIDEMKKNKKFELARHVLRTLLQQNVYRKSSQGLWTLQLCTLLHVNFKDINQAAEECFKGLSNDTFGVVHRMHIQIRAEKVCKSIKDKSQTFYQKLQQVIIKTPKSARFVEISARLYAGMKRGVKRTYIRENGDTKEFLSVEELVRAHYRSLGFVYGTHDEGTTIASLCYLTLWDIIYDVNIPYVFISPFQDKPLDWGSKDFYSAREASIENRFRLFLSETEEFVARELIKAFEKYKGIASVVTWSKLENLHFQEFLECLKVPVFINICRRLIQDVKTHRSGFPDLILWNPSERKLYFIEVKSPTDTLSTVQSIWLDFLTESGAIAFVAHVRDTGSRSCESHNDKLHI